MTITQTVEIPANRRIIFDVPPQTPTGRARVIIQYPIREDEQADEDIPQEAKGQINNEAFRSALRRAYGAWEDNPWTDCVADISAVRDEWDHRDPWNTDPVKRHQD